jgi:hypothetical protein
MNLNGITATVNYSGSGATPQSIAAGGPGPLGTGETTNLNLQAFCRSFQASCYTEIGLSSWRGQFAMRK